MRVASKLHVVLLLQCTLCVGGCVATVLLVVSLQIDDSPHPITLWHFFLIIKFIGVCDMMKQQYRVGVMSSNPICHQRVSSQEIFNRVQKLNEKGMHLKLKQKA